MTKSYNALCFNIVCHILHFIILYAILYYSFWRETLFGGGSLWEGERGCHPLLPCWPTLPRHHCQLLLRAPLSACLQNCHAASLSACLLTCAPTPPYQSTCQPAYVLAPTPPHTLVARNTTKDDRIKWDSIWRSIISCNIIVYNIVWYNIKLATTDSYTTLGLNVLCQLWSTQDRPEVDPAPLVARQRLATADLRWNCWVRTSERARFCI